MIPSDEGQGIAFAEGRIEFQGHYGRIDAVIMFTVHILCLEKWVSLPRP